MNGEDFGTSFDPYTPPQSELQADARPGNPEALRPVPFEDLEAMPGFWKRVGATFGLALTKPMAFFERVPITEGLGAPLRFQYLLAVPMMMLMAFMGLFMGIIGKLAGAESGAKAPPPAWLFPALSGFYTVMVPIGVVVGFFLGGVLLHGLLWVWGGLRNGRELKQTLRAFGYFMAFYSLASLVPCLNYIVPLVAPVPLGLGLARLHRTDPWRGVCAAYSPVLFCCLFAAGLVGAMALGALK